MLRLAAQSWVDGFPNSRFFRYAIVPLVVSLRGKSDDAKVTLFTSLILFFTGLLKPDSQNVRAPPLDEKRRFWTRDTFQALYVYLSEYHSGKRVSHKRVLELSYEDVKSAKNGLIVITPDFDNFTAKLIAADEYSKYMTETPILEGVANREYYGRSATSIENKSTIEYGTEQGLAALIYGEQGVSSLPIQDITGEYIDTDNEYMYYYSAEFVK